MPDATIRAYADDLAMVLPALENSLSELETIFEEYEKLSGLRLRHGKSILVPLFHGKIEHVRAIVTHCAPTWGDFSIQFFAKYLGYVMGPERANLSWNAPFKKFEERSRAWSAIDFGMHFAIQASKHICFLF